MYPVVSANYIMVETNIFEINGWKFAFLFRILPSNTYNVMNYIFGFTSLDLCALLISDFYILSLNS